MSDSFQPKLGYVRRAVLLTLVLVAIGVILFGGYQWNIYHRNLQVSDANLLPFPALTYKDRILILSPHPDDETLGAGGLMAKARSLGIPVRVVFLTNGDGSLATRLLQDAHFVEQMAQGKSGKRPDNIYRQIAPMRQKEALAALAELNVPANAVTFLGYPDGGTKSMWETNWNVDNPYRSAYTKINHSPYANSWTLNAPYCGQQALQDLEQILIGFKPTLVLTTNSYDTHPDHWAAFAYLNAAVCQLQLQQKYFSWAGKIRCFTFIVHHGLWPAPHGYHPAAELSPPAALMSVGISWFRFVLGDKPEKAKVNALQQYKSQLATTPQFLRGFLRRNELFAWGKNSEVLKKEESSSWEEIIKDPRNDLLLPELLSAGDIRNISVKKKGKVLLLKIDTAKKPWRDMTYVVTAHLITAQSISLCKINIGIDSNRHWQAIANLTGKQSWIKKTNLKIEMDNTKITIQIPLNLLTQKINSDYINFISATSFLHGQAIDQTPTQIIH